MISDSYLAVVNAFQYLILIFQIVFFLFFYSGHPAENGQHSGFHQLLHHCFRLVIHFLFDSMKSMRFQLLLSIRLIVRL